MESGSSDLFRHMTSQQEGLHRQRRSNTNHRPIMSPSPTRTTYEVGEGRSPRPHVGVLSCVYSQPPGQCAAGPSRSLTRSRRQQSWGGGRHTHAHPSVWAAVRGHCHCVPTCANSSLVSRQSHHRRHPGDGGHGGTCSTPRLFRALFRDPSRTVLLALSPCFMFN